MRPDIQLQVKEETAEHRMANEVRRARVLAHPDLAELLCKPPLSLTSPLFWSGYIPPAYWRERPNDSPVRRQLLMICNLVKERDEQAAQGQPVAPPLVSEKTLQIMHIHFDEYGIRDRDEKLLYLAAELGRRVESSKDLTEEEARAVSNKLHQLIKLEDKHDQQALSEVTGEAPHELTAEDQPRPQRAADSTFQHDDGPKYPGEEPVAEFDTENAPWEGKDDEPPY